MNFTELLCVGNETFVPVQNCTAIPEKVQYVLGDAFYITLYVMIPVTFIAFCVYVAEDRRKKREKHNRVVDGTRIEDLV